MNLPRYEPDRELADTLLDAAEAAKREVRTSLVNPFFDLVDSDKARREYHGALADAWEAGRLLPVKTLTLSNEDTPNAD